MRARLGHFATATSGRNRLRAGALTTPLPVGRRHGHLEIGNNAAERTIHSLALGCKNWLSAGSDWGSNSAAAYVPTKIAKLSGLDPEACLRGVLERAAEHPNQPNRRLVALGTRRVPAVA